MVFNLLIMLMIPQAGASGNQPSSPFPIVSEIDRVGSESATTIKFEIDRGGKVTSCITIKTSGSDVLDEGACKIIREKARFRPYLNPVTGKPEATSMTRRIVWRVEG